MCNGRAAYWLFAHPCYLLTMAKTHVLADTVMPSAVMSEEEIAAWNSLSREEQERRLKNMLDHPDCRTPSNLTFEEVLERARVTKMLFNFLQEKLA